MKTYIGSKIIQAEPCTDNDFRDSMGRPLLASDEEGYMVRYPDGYTSWSPKAVFEEAYRPLNGGELEMAAEENKQSM